MIGFDPNNNCIDIQYNYYRNDIFLYFWVCQLSAKFNTDKELYSSI